VKIFIRNPRRTSLLLAPAPCLYADHGGNAHGTFLSEENACEIGLVMLMRGYLSTDSVKITVNFGLHMVFLFRTQFVSFRKKDSQDVYAVSFECQSRI
jgi:hypothetical protein